MVARTAVRTDVSTADSTVGSKAALLAEQKVEYMVVMMVG